MEKKLISAVITTHNRKELLIRAVMSACNQTYQNLEIIVVDDASTDGTGEKLSEIKDSRIRYIYIRPEESKGGNYARNTGIRNAKGEYIAFLDDDDEWLPEKIEKQYVVVHDHPEVSFVACARIYEYDFKKQIKQKISDLIEGDLSQTIFTTMPYTTSAIMVNKSLLKEVGMFDEQLCFWQDYDLEIRLCQKGNVAVVKDFLLLYRVITADKGRLTNNIDGWIEAVSYIESKYKELIDKLPNEYKKKRNAMIGKDGARRAGRNENLKLQREYLKKAFINEKNIKNFVKYCLNISRRNG